MEPPPQQVGVPVSLGGGQGLSRWFWQERETLSYFGRKEVRLSIHLHIRIEAAFQTWTWGESRSVLSYC